MVAETSKSKKPAKNKKSATDPGDIELLKSEIASVASSLGLSSSLPSSGFNDSDFRKKGPLKPQNPSDNQRPQKPKKDANAKEKKETFAGKKETFAGKETFTGDDKRKPKPKAAVLSIDENKIGNSVKGVDKFRNLPKLPLVKASALAVWYEDAQQLEAKVIGLGKKLEVKNAEEWKAFVEKKRELGERLMVQYSQDYESSRGQSGDIKMLVATQRSGTAADKVSAFSVMVGDNPIANLRSLDGLVGLVTSKVGKRHALTGFEVLKELFVSSLLPDRKLKTLLQRPLNHLSETKDGYSLLLFWYWEECLKQRYERFIFALEEASRDMLPVLKDKALKTMSQLLKSKSEQERRLLSALVNKLGDPQNKGASNAEYHLSNLLMEHPNMQAVVIDEVDSFLFRPHLGLRAKYHAVNFLSQFRLSHRGDGPKVAKRLIDVYFALFKVLITEAGAGQDTDKNSKKDHKKVAGAKGKTNESESHVELDSRILSALLTGVNRAFPFVSSTEADDIVEVQTPLLFQLVHSKNFNIGIQALMLLDKISSKNQIVSDRFYRALYSKLLLPAAMHSSKAEMFIGLLLRAMKNDVNLKRVAAFSKRLLQVALQVPPQYACGYLFLVSELLKARPPLWNMVQQSESVDDELEHFEDIKEESDKEDAESDKQKNNAESRADAKTESVSSEDEDDAPVPASCNDDDSDDDVTDEDVELFVKNVPENDEETNDGSRKTRGDSTRHLLPGGYDPRHREPSYSNADCVCWWELMVLASHVHPSVATMARTLLSGTNIVYNGNPLNDLSLTAFLEKLMEKKPKASTWHGGSQIEPAKKLEMNNHLIGAELLSLAETDVPPEDLVFHKFYLNKMNTTRKQKKKKKKGKEEEDAEELFEVDGGDESDNEEIDNILDEAEITSDKEDGEYDYDDLDRIGFDSDDDLVGDASDVELDGPSEGEDFDFDVADDDDDVDGANDADDNDNGDDDDDVAIGDVDDGSDDDANEETFLKAKKRKLGKRTGVSPFASLEDYKHLMQDDDAAAEDSPKLKKSRKEKSKSQKKQQKKKKSTE